MALRCFVLIFTLAYQGLPANSEGDCLSSDGCTDDLDDGFSTLQVMLQLEVGSRKPRHKPSAAAKASAQSAPASVQQETTQRTDVALKPTLNAAPTLLQLDQEHSPGQYTVEHRATTARVSINDSDGASSGAADGGGAPVIPPELTGSPLQLKPPEHAAASKASFAQTAAQFLAWWKHTLFRFCGQLCSTTMIGVSAIFAGLYAVLWLMCRRDAKRLWADRLQQKGDILLTKNTGLESASMFETPKLPDAAASFAIPVMSLASCSADVESFDIAEAHGAVKLRGVLSRLSPGGSWANVEVFDAHSTSGAKTLLASCSLAGSAADIERMNVTGALDSWLSLLMHEKSQSIEYGDTSDEDNDETLPAVCDGGVSDKEPMRCDCGSPKNHKSFPRLEVKDSIGSVFGVLEPNRDGHYCFLCQSRVAFEVEFRLNDKWIALKKDGKVCALATGVLQGGSPECTPEEFLQVDILAQAQSQETVSMLICILAIVALNAS